MFHWCALHCWKWKAALPVFIISLFFTIHLKAPPECMTVALFRSSTRPSVRDSYNNNNKPSRFHGWWLATKHNIRFITENRPSGCYTLSNKPMLGSREVSCVCLYAFSHKASIHGPVVSFNGKRSQRWNTLFVLEKEARGKCKCTFISIMNCRFL